MVFSASVNFWECVSLRGERLCESKIKLVAVYFNSGMTYTFLSILIFVNFHDESKSLVKNGGYEGFCIPCEIFLFSIVVQKLDVFSGLEILENRLDYFHVCLFVGKKKSGL